MNVLVTGGAGFIGSNIVAGLLEDGFNVRVLDNLVTGRRDNLSGLKGKVDFVLGDVRDLKVVRKAVSGVDFVLHQAALPSVPRSISDPVLTNECNVSGTVNVLFAAKEAGVKRVVYAGSSSAYGDTPTLPKREDMTPMPLSPYAVSKLAGEYYCSVFSGVYGLETTTLRYFNVFGPRQDPSSQYAAVIPKFIKMISAGKRPTIYGDGTQTRDFTYVKNVVDANILAIKAKKTSGEVVNIACGERITLTGLASKLADVMGSNLKPEYVSELPGDIKHSLADISKAKKLLGYKPSVSFEEGLEVTVKWFLK